MLNVIYQCVQLLLMHKQCVRVSSPERVSPPHVSHPCLCLTPTVSHPCLCLTDPEERGVGGQRAAPVPGVPAVPGLGRGGGAPPGLDRPPGHQLVSELLLGRPPQPAAG